jgi:L-alanine-DL-glutamate epimerase-like enolase superfamily enzyme
MYGGGQAPRVSGGSRVGALRDRDDRDHRGGAVALMAVVERVDVSAYEIPTDGPESDGTLTWDATTIVVVEAHGGGRTGIGYTYCHRAAAEVVAGTLAGVVEGTDVLAPQTAWSAMARSVRNSLASGLCGFAISAVDVALHDLKARLLDLSVADLVGRWHDGVDVYGSGGFLSYSRDQLQSQAAGWIDAGIVQVKIKVGRDRAADGARLQAVREVIGSDARLMVDANGAFTPGSAIAAARGTYADAGVTWLEEPVSSDDHDGLRRVRDHAPPGMEIAAGEYGSDIFHPQRLLTAGAVDVLQADVTRCGGITGLMRADALAKAHCLPLSAHCAPAISAHAFAACETTVHLEYFHDHVRVERLLFDGTLSPEGGRLTPDGTRPGLGIELKRAEAERFRVSSHG